MIDAQTWSRGLESSLRATRRVLVHQKSGLELSPPNSNAQNCMPWLCGHENVLDGAETLHSLIFDGVELHGTSSLGW